jgi:proteic killer suppression protein
MDVVFANETLALVETEEAGKTRLPVAVIKSARRKLTVIRAAPDDRSLRNWKSLHYEKLKGGRDGMRSIRLNDQFSMILTVDESQSPQVATVIAIEDYH